MATYYVSQIDGNDSYDGLYDTWIGELNGPWLTISRVNNLNGAPDDFVLFRRGGVWREMFTLKGTGSSGHPLTYGAYGSGANPKIMGSEAIAGWENYSGNVWRASTTQPLGTGGDPDYAVVWLIKISDGKTKYGTHKSTIGGCTSEYDWCWDTDYLYVNSGGSGSEYDPDTRYTSIEVARRRSCIQRGGAFSTFVTIQNFECCYTYGCGTRFDMSEWTDFIIEDCVFRNHGYIVNWDAHGIYTESPRWIIRRNIVSECGNHGIYILSTGGTYDNEYSIVEENEIFNCYHTNIDVMALSSSTTTQNITVRKNLIYNNSDRNDLTTTCNGIYFSAVAPAWCLNCEASYNIIYNIMNRGIECGRQTDGMEIYNNTVYKRLSGADSGLSAGIYVEGTDVIQNHIIKNNLVMDAGAYCFYTDDLDQIAAMDCNLWYQSAGGAAVYAYVEGTSYHYDDFIAYKAAMFTHDPNFEQNALWENPDMNDPDNQDFSLTAVSPCIDAGLDVGLTEDYVEIPVPQGAAPDIGAYEYTQAQTLIRLIKMSVK